MKIPIDKDWFEKRAVAEGDHEIGAGGSRRTMTLNLTEEEIAELERLVNPNRDAIRAGAFEEAALLVEGQWNNCTLSPHQPYTKAYCLTRSSWHDNEAERCKRDLEVALAEHPQKPHLVDLFTHRHKQHTRYAEAWREAVDGAPE